MSEFRKSYEYMEEQGIAGFPLVFFIMLLTIELLLGATTMVQGYRAVKDTPALSTILLAVGSAYLLLILATSIALRKSFRLGATLSKVFLLVRVPVLVPVYVFLFAAMTTLQGGSEEPLSPGAVLITRLIAPVGYIVLFSAAWYAYFLKSKRVRELCVASRRPS